MNKESKFQGLPISSGVSYSKVCLFNDKRHNNLPEYKVEGIGLHLEKQRYKKATAIVLKSLEKLFSEVKEKIGISEAEIFNAQKMILSDISIQNTIIKHIEDDKDNAETAIIKSFEFYENRLLEMDDDYIKERATDIGEVKRRLLDVLSNFKPDLQCKGNEHCQQGKNRIIIAEELTPTLTLHVDTENTKGFVTEKGGITSHAAILARSLKIPAVSGIKNIHNSLYCGTSLLVNGDTGEVIVSPSKETLKKYPDIEKATRLEIETVPPLSDFKVMANLNLEKNVSEVLKYQAEGIGLYRTEFEFLASGKLISEDEQYKKYMKVLDEMKGFPVHFRLLDIGGDKNAPFFKLAKEENPYLGFRGSRLLLGRPDLFKPQARALARASINHKVNIMYPMIIDKEQFQSIRKTFIEHTRDIKGQNISHGLMFEVPSACFEAEEILKEAEFASIGSNDLIQYLFAVDRNNENVAYDYTSKKPIFWQILEILSAAALKHKKHISFCGEIASDPDSARKLKKLGINTVSVSPKLISGLRKSLLQ